MITIDFARTLYPAEVDSAHDFDHILRVVHLVKKIAQAEGANVEVVRVARCCTSRHRNGRRSAAEIHPSVRLSPDRSARPINRERLTR